LSKTIQSSKNNYSYWFAPAATSEVKLLLASKRTQGIYGNYGIENFKNISPRMSRDL